VAYIWYAPNHLRAFRRTAYEKAGGYDMGRSILDDQDLMNRLYQITDFHKMDEALYRQRVHPGNTQKEPETNARIQRETVEIYDRDIQPMAMAWAKRNDLACLDFGGAFNCPEGYEPVDLRLGTDAFSTGRRADSVGVIRAVDFLEHVPDKIGLMNEAWRLLAHGGMFLSLTPSSDGRGAYQDPTHVSFWNENSFWYYTDENYAQYVEGIECRFQVSRLFTFHPSDWHREHDISYVCANLVALKDGPRMAGLCGWS
jgi:SAM-dependent methyltransferase